VRRARNGLCDRAVITIISDLITANADRRRDQQALRDRRHQYTPMAQPSRI